MLNHFYILLVAILLMQDSPTEAAGTKQSQLIGQTVVNEIQPSLTNKTLVNKKIHPCFRLNNPICSDIVKLQPKIPLNSALVMSNSFFRVSRRYGLNPKLLLAIAFQESAFKLDAVRSVNGYVFEDDMVEEVRVGSDFCMFQVNIGNIKNMELDVKKLLQDMDYCVDSGARILKNFERRFKGKEFFWWTRYNAHSARHREVYQKYITKHAVRIGLDLGDSESESKCENLDRLTLTE